MSASLQQLESELNDRILQGDILGAFEDFYAEDVVMEEGEDKRVGKDDNREYEEQFVGALQEFHKGEVTAAAIDEEKNVTFSEWDMEFTLEGAGRVRQRQVAVRTWNDDGKIVNEKFYSIGG
ncbi:nuclear transport factor 2 family protein [Salisaeta longa]|uniref:nuclear transport factor 2 family protein n=1 Tax=Salisaeta longa TaxID=503170 RepID=UPI0003B368E2|nr:nuclear transport factor 2 family protein [Salisaeta longa]